MKKLILALAVAGFAVSSARADFGTPPRPAPAGGGGGGEPVATNQYGWNPILKKVFWWKKGSSDCATGNCGGKAGCAGGNCGPAANAGPVGGTLVFPQHPFARSPRDYFMYGQGGN